MSLQYILNLFIYSFISLFIHSFIFTYVYLFIGYEVLPVQRAIASGEDMTSCCSSL